MTLLYNDPCFLQHETGDHPERAQRVQDWLDFQEQEIDAILADDLVTTDIKYHCRRLATAVGSLRTTVEVELLAMACQGPRPKQPSPADLLRHHLTEIEDLATTLHDKHESGDLSDTDTWSATADIIAHVYESRQLLNRE